MRSAKEAIWWSCVIMTVVTLCSRDNSEKMDMIDSAVFSSRLPVGSSARRNGASFTNARAIPTRCCSPPDKSLGYLPALSLRPTRSSISSVAYRRFAFHISIESSTFSYTVRWSRSSNDWKIIDTFVARKSESSSPMIVVISFEPSNTEPLVGVLSPAITERRVDFPTPLAPIKATKSPDGIMRSRLWKRSGPSDWWRYERLLIWIMKW